MQLKQLNRASKIISLACVHNEIKALNWLIVNLSVIEAIKSSL